MRTTVIAIILFAFIITSSVLFDCHVKSSVESISDNIKEFKLFIDNNDKENAKNCFRNIQAEWKRDEKFLQIMTEHSELDSINEFLSKLSAACENDEYSSVYENIYSLEYFINHIYEKKIINITTIL